VFRASRERGISLGSLGDSVREHRLCSAARATLWESVFLGGSAARIVGGGPRRSRRDYFVGHAHRGHLRLQCRLAHARRLCGPIVLFFFEAVAIGILAGLSWLVIMVWPFS